MQKPKLPTFTQLTSGENFSRLASALKFSTIAAVIVALYYQDLSIIFYDALHDEATFHILAIPFLFAYLVYRKRKMIKASIQQKETTTAQTKNLQTAIGILLCATAVILYWFGSYTFTPLEYHMLTLPVFAAGLILILFNAQTIKQLAFPIAFLVFLTPPPIEILYGIGSTLSALTAQASNALVNAFGMSSAISSEYGNPIIMLTRPDQTVMNFSVDIACSGVYSLIGFGIFAIFIAYITRGRMRNKPVILIMGIPLIIALNIVRLTAILTIGYYYGDQLALQVFHLVGATALMFIGTLLLLAITEKTLKTNAHNQPCPSCSANQLTEDSCPDCGKLHKVPKVKLRRSDLTKILGIAIVTVMLLTIQAPVFALTEGPAEVIIQTPAGEQGNTQILPQIPGYTLNYIYRDSNFEQLVGEDASLVYAYAPTDQSKPTVWVAVEVSQTIGVLHRWETCLITFPLSQGYQPRVTQIDLKDTQTLANPPIIGRYFAFQYRKTNQTQLVLYWYETSTFNKNGTSQQKHVKMSLVIFPKAPQDVSTAENQLLPFATAINDYWQPIKTWTQVALAISQNGLILSTATASLLVVILMYQAFLNMQARLLLLKLFGKLSEQDKLLIKAVRQASKLGNSTTSSIANQMKELAKTPASPNWLTEKLQEAADAGLVKKTIANMDDTPAVTWRNQVPEKTFTLKWPRIHLRFSKKLLPQKQLAANPSQPKTKEYP